MIARLLSPASAVVVAILLGVCAGPAWYWTKASALAAQTMSLRQGVAAEEKVKVEVRRAHGWDFWTVEMENLASELKEEKAGLRKRSEEMDQRESRLTAERQELERVRSDIESMRQDIDERAIAIKADESKNLKGLAKTYAALSPAAAVAIIRELDETTAVKILHLMPPDIVGPIFETMSTTPSPDGTMARRVAALSDKLRLMRSDMQAPAP